MINIRKREKQALLNTLKTVLSDNKNDDGEGEPLV